MKIKKIHYFVQSIPLTVPYSIAYKTTSKAHILVLEIELTNGIVGYGSAAPSAEVVGINAYDSLKLMQEAEFQEKLIGADITDFYNLIRWCFKTYPNDPGISAALDLALHDAICKHYKVSVAQFYGQIYNGLNTSVTIGIKNVSETLDDATKFVSQGFNALKIKIGSHFEEDLERVIKLQELFKSSIEIRLDANQGYEVDSLLKLWNYVKNETNITIIEQPLKIGEEDKLLTLPLELRAILVGDESLKNPQDALKYAVQKNFGVFNIKLMKCGGIFKAREIETIAAIARLDIFWGCNDESLLSIAAALHCAYSCPQTKYIDLDGSFDLASDFFNKGFVLKNGKMFLLDTIGLGVEKLY
ncbi:MAG: enolase C-terminal domain-like protein [Alphaproteobacteria bacterium]|nr:enolase C-terminal domain-like protein [Alphaproteobacteria bacterium]